MVLFAAGLDVAKLSRTVDLQVGMLLVLQVTIPAPFYSYCLYKHHLSESIKLPILTKVT